MLEFLHVIFHLLLEVIIGPIGILALIIWWIWYASNDRKPHPLAYDDNFGKSEEEQLK